jgi:tetratricopeptide (TPR) repeat protein
VAVLAVSGVLIWRLLPKNPGSPATASGKPSIAILYFENLSSDPTLEGWRTGLSDLLITSLSQSKLITVLDGNRTYSVLKKLNLDQAKKYSREDLVKVANEGGANYTASGSLMRAGENIVTMLTLQKPHTGEVIDSIKLTCQNEAEILPKTDELAAKIKSAFNLSPAQIAGDKGLDMQKITTSSPEALKYYLESQKYYRTVEYSKVIGLCEKAVEIDPQFALAYYMLDGAYLGSGNMPKAHENMKKAFDLRDRTTERERYLIEANYYKEQGEDAQDKTIEAFTKYLELSPYDAGEIETLGFQYMNREDYEKGLELMKRAYKIDRSPQYLGALGQAYRPLGLYQETEDLLKDYLKNNPATPLLHWVVFWNYVLQKEYEEALSETEKGFLLDPAPKWGWSTQRAIVHLLEGNLADAEKEFLQVIAKESKEDRADARGNLISLYLLQGRFGRAREELVQATAPEGELEPYTNRTEVANLFLRLNEYDRASRIIKSILRTAVEGKDLRMQIRALWWQGLVNIERKAIPEAEKTAAELKVVCGQSINKKNIRFYEHLQGLVELEKGDYSRAAERLRTACSMLPFEQTGSYIQLHALYIYPLAFACYKSGDLEGARREYEKVTTLTTGRLYFGDLYAKSFYWLGRIAEGQNDKGRARENFRRFLDLRKSADPGQPEVDDAKARLAALKP